MTKLYIGDRLDLELMYEEDIILFIFNILNADETVYDFTGFTDVYIEIYDANTKRKLQQSLVMNTNLTIPTPTNGQIEFKLDYNSDISIRTGEYYYRLSYLDTQGKKQSVIYGDFKIVR